MKRANIHIYGKVQGVFFRAFAKRNAEMLGIKGFARNLPDGSVEVVAEGDEKLLDKLIFKLSKGPPSASVRRVQITKTRAKGKFINFKIR